MKESQGRNSSQEVNTGYGRTLLTEMLHKATSAYFLILPGPPVTIQIMLGPTGSVINQENAPQTCLLTI